MPRAFVVMSLLFLSSCSCSRKAGADAGGDAGALGGGDAPAPDVPARADLLALAAPTSAEAEALFAARGIGRVQPGLEWRCSPARNTVLCLATRAVRDVPELEAGNGLGQFTQVRLARVEGEAISVAEWPAPRPALYALANDDITGDDCGWGCDEGGDPVEDPEPDEPAGVGTGACYAGCSRHYAAEWAGTVSIDTTLELVGALADGRFFFKRTVVRTRNEDPWAESEEPAEPGPGEEEAAPAEPAPEPLEPTTVDFLVLHHPGGEGALGAAEAQSFTSLERPSSSVWLAGSDQGTAVFLELGDGGVLVGEEACAVLAREDAPLERCDGGVLDPPAARAPAPFDAGAFDFAEAMARLDRQFLQPAPNPYSFTRAGWRPRVAWFDTTFREKRFSSVLFSSDAGVRAFLLPEAREVWALGRASVAVRDETELCVRAILGGDEVSRARSSVVWCGDGEVVDVDGEPSLEVLSGAADSGVTLVEEVAGEVVVRGGRDACAHLTRRPPGFEGCR